MKILVVRFSSLGDVVLTTAILPNLKKKWPEAEIAVLTKAPYAPLFERNPSLDHVRIFDPAAQSFTQLVGELRDQRFDLVVDLHNNMRSWLVRFMTSAPLSVTVDKFWWARMMLVWFKRASPVLQMSVRERILETLKPLEAPVVSEETQLFPDPSLDVVKLFDLPAGHRLIGVAPGARHATKRWPVGYFAEAANRLGAEPNTTVVLLGDKSDGPAVRDVANRLVVSHKNLAGWTSLRELIAVLSKLSFLLTNDSGVMHMAEALKVPLLALFGPTVRPFGFAPYRPTSRASEVINLACRPCSLHGTETCPLGHHKCMKDLDVDAALFAASTLFQKDL